MMRSYSLCLCHIVNSFDVLAITNEIQFQYNNGPIVGACFENKHVVLRWISYSFCIQYIQQYTINSLIIEFNNCCHIIFKIWFVVDLIKWLTL